MFSNSEHMLERAKWTWLLLFLFLQETISIFMKELAAPHHLDAFLPAVISPRNSTQPRPGAHPSPPSLWTCFPSQWIRKNAHQGCLPEFNPVCTLCSLKSSYTGRNSSLLIFDYLSGKMGRSYWASQQASLAQSFKVNSQLIDVLASLEAIYCQTLWSRCTKNFTTKCMLLMKNAQGDFQYPQFGIWITPRSAAVDLWQK